MLDDKHSASSVGTAVEELSSELTEFILILYFFLKYYNKIKNFLEAHLLDNKGMYVCHK